MSIAENKAKCHECVDLWNDRESEAAGQTYAEDYVYHGPTGELRGREAIKSLWQSFITGFPDMHATDIELEFLDRLQGSRVLFFTHLFDNFLNFVSNLIITSLIWSDFKKYLDIFQSDR